MREAIKIEVDGRVVRGFVVRRDPRHIWIELDHPVLPLRLGVNVPLFAASVVNFCEARGDREARRLVMQADEVVRHVLAHLNELIVAWRAAKEEAERVVEPPPFDKAAARRSLRAGTLDQRSFMALVREHRKRQRQYRHDRQRPFADVFRHRFPPRIAYHLCHAQLSRFLDRQCH